MILASIVMLPPCNSETVTVESEVGRRKSGNDMVVTELSWELIFKLHTGQVGI